MSLKDRQRRNGERGCVSAPRTEKGMAQQTTEPVRKEAYGQRRLTWVDRFGVYLSKRRILRYLPGRGDLSMLDLGCGYQATMLRALLPYTSFGLGVDVR